MTKLPPTGLFWDKVDTSGDCWIWMGARNDRGYGHLNRFGKTIAAHRYAYEQVIGPIPEGMEVCHTCDVRACVRPAHLFLGTSHDNHVDMVKKVRGTQGQSHYAAKLSNADVLEIRRLYDSRLASHVELAKRFGVTAKHISSVATRKRWRHV